MPAPLSITVDVTAADLVATQLHQLEHSPVARRGRQITYGMVTAVSVLVVIAVVIKRQAPMWQLVVFGLLAIYTAWRQTRMGRRSRVRREVGTAKGLTGPVGLTFDDDGVELSAEGESRRVAWSALTGVSLEAEHAFLRFAPGTTVIGVPARAITTELRERLAQLATRASVT